MTDPDYAQIIEGLGQGVAVLDAECRILSWNRWMERASGLSSAEVLGKTLTGLYPDLDQPAFRRNFRSVLSFGIVACFSQLLHGGLFPWKPSPGSPEGFGEMQQRCVMGPLRVEGRLSQAYLLVEDVTETVSYQRRLAELALRDGLTQAWNRRYFDRRLAEELERERRYGRGLSLAMLDIDHFKAVNDSFGHQFGDEALKTVAATCAAAIRATDVLARYGGEEFCVLLPETGAEGARGVAERAREAVQARDVEALGRRTRLTVSVGLSAASAGDSPDSVLRRADAALYRAKESGRNRVEVQHE
jgi:diguanylate cyclase (GGDEF)-like protein